jgi:guanylate kinase
VLEELRTKAAGKHQPRLYVLSAASGTGKDSVLAGLRERGVDLHVVVTVTTRPRRPAEVDGVDYQFVSTEEFLAMRTRGELLEDVRYSEHFYGVPARPVHDALTRGQDTILKIEVRGASMVKLQIPGTVLIFMAPPEVGELERRIRLRGAIDEQDLARRLAEAQRELACIPGYDYLVINHPGRLQEAITQMEHIIMAERLRVNVTGMRI